MELLNTLIICITAFFALCIILIALPGSKLRSFLLEAFGWAGATASSAALLSPIDIVPDFIPIFGLLDDPLYCLFAVMFGLLAYRQRRNRHEATIATNTNLMERR